MFIELEEVYVQLRKSLLFCLFVNKNLKNIVYGKYVIIKLHNRIRYFVYTICINFTGECLVG
jgi:hypothetical protein